MTLAQAGMRDALAMLVERHGRRIVQLCARFVGDTEIGEEIAQETWLIVWSQRANYRADGKFIVWLISVARNRCRNHLRHEGVVERKTRGPSGAPLMQGIDSTSPDHIDRALLAERRRRVREALCRLPANMREALLLRYAEDLHYDEMAEVLSTRQSTLRSRVHHGLRLLRNLLEKKRR
jgi:RNA polymerase sigma-70 factor (ECF subfamily)